MGGRSCLRSSAQSMHALCVTDVQTCMGRQGGPPRSHATICAEGLLVRLRSPTALGSFKPPCQLCSVSRHVQQRIRKLAGVQATQADFGSDGLLLCKTQMYSVCSRRSQARTCGAPHAARVNCLCAQAQLGPRLSDSLSVCWSRASWGYDLVQDIVKKSPF